MPLVPTYALGSYVTTGTPQWNEASRALTTSARVGNYHHPEYPELEDFGDLTLVGADGATAYHRVDWFTPEGLATWGDGRLVLLGTEG